MVFTQCGILILHYDVALVSNVVVKFTDKDAISAHTCSKRIDLSTSFDDEELFDAAMKALILEKDFTMV